MTFAWHHPSYYKKLKPKQTGLFFGKKVTVDLSKDLKEQTWFKSDLFGEREKDVIVKAWEGLPENKIPKTIKEIEEEEYYEQ